MAELTQERLAEMMAQNAELDAAHARATREALLEHARAGRSVSQRIDGKVVWVTPEEIFARYRLDANGRPVTS
jgi:hypothetical protein